LNQNYPVILNVVDHPNNVPDVISKMQSFMTPVNYYSVFL